MRDGAANIFQEKVRPRRQGWVPDECAWTGRWETSLHPGLNCHCQLNPETPPKPRSPLHFLLRHPLSLESETSWFLLLGALDLVLTTVLLNTGVVHEANPLARFFLFVGGLNWLIGYKFGLLTVAAVAAQIILLHRPRAAKAVLHTGIGVQLLVVAYSVTLLVKVTV